MRSGILALILAAGAHAELFDLAPFGRPCCSEDRHRLQTTFDYAHPRGVVQAASGAWVYGLQWAEERDIEQVLVRFEANYDARSVAVQYWFLNWPYDPPHMPTIEDPIDDPWQGEWLTARSKMSCEGRDCRWTFAPLNGEENLRAKNLPGVPYRRAIKMRLVFPPGTKPDIRSVSIFSESTVRPMEVRVQFGVDGAKPPSRPPTFTAYNGRIRESKSVSGGVLLSLDTTDPRPAGSSDVTVIEVHNGRESFAFTPSDVEKGPMYVQDFHAYITLASDTTPFSSSIVKSGSRIRERLAAEPEQTYERASREIPSLDPVERQGGRLYLPLAADASWQKFAFEWGGNVTISKRETKAKGRELQRLTWPGDRISWRIGTGETPAFRPRSVDSTLSVLEDYLPVATARWKSGGIEYEEEAFASLLSGPLSSEDPARSEQTPAVLLVRLRAHNPSQTPQTSHVWLGMDPAERLSWKDGVLSAGDSIRAALKLPAGSSAQLDSYHQASRQVPALHVSARIDPGQNSVIYLNLPFIPGLAESERAALTGMAFDAERSRVVDYWRRVTGKGVPFQVPEERFNSFARGLVARIRISATKDPKSGIYMVPAASYSYQVFADESVFQCQFLDVAGFRQLAAKYLQAQVDLQGSRPFLGSYTGDQKAVYHGARVDAEYDYTASEYNLDHGAVLWSLAEHYLITRDAAWLRSVASSMKRAADWVVEQRKLTQVMADGKKCPEYGLLPGGHLEDNPDWGHWFSVNAYASVGMTELAAALDEIGDKDAPRYAREAGLYREDLRAAVMRATAASPVIRLRDNTWVPYVPTRMHQRIRLFGPLRVAYYTRYPEKVLPTYRLSATRELLYGPLILFDTGVFDANDPIAHWVLDDWEDNATMSEPLGLHVHGWVDEKYWFSRGGMVFQANLQNPIRTYIRRGEDRAAVRNLYNDFVACYYPSVNVFTEEYRQWRSPSGPFYKIPDEAKFVHRLRDLMLTEYNGELLLAPATPGRWLAPGQKLSVTDAPTHFGPVSYSLEGSAGEVSGRIALPARNPYRAAWLYVHLPDHRTIASVTIDGREWSRVDKEKGRIRLPESARPFEISIRTR